MRISDWSSDVCSSDLLDPLAAGRGRRIGIDRAFEPAVEFAGADPARPCLARLERDLEQRIDALAGRPRDGEQRNALGLRQPVLERPAYRSEEHTSELQSLMRISYAVFCLKTKNI